MSKAIRFHEIGGPDVLKLEDVPVAEPGAGEVRLRHHALGLNYIDTYHRTGLYPVPLPSGIGLEAAGVVDAVGEGVELFAVGDRVAYAGGPIGAYAETRCMPANLLLRLPDSIDFDTGAAMMLAGLTAQYLLRQTYGVQAGDTILIHAAAGGVGLIVCQWAKALGATVIGTVGTEEKAALARTHGCDHTILYRTEKVSERVREITGGKGVPVVYDSIGRDTFMDSLACLQPRGLMVSYGNASGPVPPLDIGILAQMGSLFLTRPTLFGYAAEREALVSMGRDLFDVVVSGTVEIEVRQRYGLADAAQAHRDLEARKTMGSTILLP